MDIASHCRVVAGGPVYVGSARVGRLSFSCRDVGFIGTVDWGFGTIFRGVDDRRNARRVL